MGHYMTSMEKDEAREDRISMEVIADAYNTEEQAMGWYYYLDDKIQFPFDAKCVVERRISPLNVGDQIKVLQMAPEDECIHEMFVEIEWSDRTFAVPLSQIQPLNVDRNTQEAIEDWHYWVSRGYEL